MACWLLLLQSLPSKGDETTNLLNPIWSGDYGTGYWGGTTGGETPNMLPNGTGFIWGHGGGLLSNTIAINNAIQSLGMQVEGFSYVWRVKNANINRYEQQGGVDPLEITVDVFKSDGTLYTTYSYDYSQFQGWTTYNGSETFPDQFLDPAFFGNLVVSADGDDVGHWTGHWGPEFNTSASSITLTYSSNPCYENALYDPSCTGYAEAIADLVLQEQELILSSPNDLVTVEENFTEVMPNVVETTQTQVTLALGNIQTQGQSSSSVIEDDQEQNQTKEEKVKEVIEERASGLQKNIVNSNSIADQKIPQAEVLAMMNYVLGFDSYKFTLPSVTYEDVQFYEITTVPDSKVGKRNNFAQQLLHQKMVQMQYRR